MDVTPVSLLRRLRESPQDEDWRQMTILCTPLLYAWVRSGGVTSDEASDLVHDVLVTLIETLPHWRYDEQRSFRKWLKTVTLNRCREFWRKKRPLLIGESTPWDRLQEGDPADLFSEKQFHAYITQRSLETIKTRFSLNTWQAFWQHVVDGDSAADVAERLGMTEGAVYATRVRVIKALRQELEGLLD
jgi:RNA polymerase sigma-70 factor (ECF subfamily)